jgi:hypothetical protein
MGEEKKEPEQKVETPKPGSQQQETTFTQADVDRIVSERLARQAKEKFGDYDELKKDADGKKTLEEQLEKLRNDLEESNAAGLRSRIAAEFGISTKKGPKGEPSDAELFLTGTDETTLTAQAERLGERVVEQKKQGNVAKKEGAAAKDNGDGTDQELREFARDLFGKADAD